LIGRARGRLDKWKFSGDVRNAGRRSLSIISKQIVVDPAERQIIARLAAWPHAKHGGRIIRDTTTTELGLMSTEKGSTIRAKQDLGRQLGGENIQRLIELVTRLGERKIQKRRAQSSRRVEPERKATEADTPESKQRRF
jgi:hypothetical protein